MDPQCSARGIQPSGDGVASGIGGSSATPSDDRALVAGCTFSGRRATTGSAAVSSPAGKVTWDGPRVRSREL